MAKTKGNRPALFPRFVPLPLFLALALASGCSDAAGASADGGDGGGAGDAGDSDPGLTMDAMTSATPGLARFVLSQTHPAWGQRQCGACHTSLHTTGYSVAECSYCHGSNGAPARRDLAAGGSHPDGACVDCHEDPHPGELFNAPNDCRGCHRYAKPVSGCTHTEEFDAVVIGGGGGGLAAASVLTQQGLSVLVIEQSYKVGGAMVNFNRGPFRFEASLHAMDGIGLVYIDMLGIGDKVQPVTGESMFQVVTPDLTFEIPANREAYQAKLKARFPDHAADIDQLFADMTEMMGSMDFGKFVGLSTVEALALYGITPEEKAFFNIITSLTGFVAGGLDVIPAPLYAGMWNTMHNMSYSYFIGGSQSITDALTQLILDNGGVIKTNALATRIVIEGGLAVEVRTDEGGCYRAGYVISNASEPDTYLKLIGEANLDAELIARLASRKPATTLSTIYLGTDKDYTGLFPGDGHEIFVFTDNVQTSDYQAASACQPEKQGLAITNYSVLDPTAAPAGKNVITISNAIGYDCNDEWKFNESYESYQAYKWEIARTYIEKAEAFLPGLSKHIEVLEVGSPQTIKAYTKNPKGSWAGWEIDPDIADPIEITAPDVHRSPFPNLFLAGAWVTEGGQSIVLMSGKAAADLVMEQYAQGQKQDHQ